ncbi:3-oxoacyl-ACP synthase [Campylobacter jejuni]|nr:3-oxoacyl-ACP synthase [Campylobacter jejuni]EHN6901579.1 3-oxoacyl-ACP synthase [Campylobacter jejuni]EHN6916308.1 3-oxoacyl-ACP synthase [Campylobacter jejuni]
MKLKLNSHTIKAISIVLPKNSHSLNEELKQCNLNENKYKILQQNTGIKNHFACPENVFASDLASKALEKLFEENLLSKDELDVLLVYSFTPDFLAPALSSLIHKNLKLSEKTLCYDNIAFCPGFLQGLTQSFLFLNNENIEKVALVCVSAKSKKISKNDKITYLSNSDSASAILIEKSNAKEKALYSQKIFSKLATKETFPLKCFKEANDFIDMDRNLVFSHLNENFPQFFEDFFTNFNLNKNEIDTFFFQSANNFIKTKLLELLDFKEIKQDETLKNYGDTTINKLALDLANYNQGGGIRQIFMASFGTGITFNAMSLKIDFSKIKSFIKIINF